MSENLFSAGVELVSLHALSAISTLKHSYQLALVFFDSVFNKHGYFTDKGVWFG